TAHAPAIKQSHARLLGLPPTYEYVVGTFAKSKSRRTLLANSGTWLSLLRTCSGNPSDWPPSARPRLCGTVAKNPSRSERSFRPGPITPLSRHCVVCRFGVSTIDQQVPRCNSRVRANRRLLAGAHRA